MAKLCSVRNGISMTLFLFAFTLPSCVSLTDYYLYNIENTNAPTSRSMEHTVFKRQTNSNLAETEQPYKYKKTTTVALEGPEIHYPSGNPSIFQPSIFANKDQTFPPETKPTMSEKKINLAVPVDDISIDDFSDGEEFNNTLKQHNITVTRIDNHLYYNSSFKTDEKTGHEYWTNMTNNSNVQISDLLSKSHRRAATVRLTFDFPFYGHLIRNVTIATGGFLYTGDYVHSWLAATQYIAPLMANFDTSLSNDSFIKYVDNGTAFTVLWENVALQDKPNDGNFTFQTTLRDNGDIVFVYQNIPIIIEKINDSHHPVKVGLSDAYIIDRQSYFIRRKTIYEYHRVNFRKEDIKNWTTIYLSALPTCPIIKDCHSCLTKQIDNFECYWCPTINKCSNGLDRARQEWIMKSCDKRQLKNESECSLPMDSFDDDFPFNHFHNKELTDDPMSGLDRLEAHDAVLVAPEKQAKVGFSGVVTLFFILSLVAAVGMWLMYAYRNPHTTSGQMLIRYRPSQWSWRRGEARYTAATIHM